LEGHAVVGAGGVVRVAKTPERAEVLADLHEVIAKIVGAGDVDLLVEIAPLRQQRNQKDGVDQQRQPARRARQQRRAQREAVAPPLLQQPKDHQRHDQRRNREQREGVRQQCGGKDQRRRPQPPRPARSAPAHEQAVEDAGRATAARPAAAYRPAPRARRDRQSDRADRYRADRPPLPPAARRQLIYTAGFLTDGRRVRRQPRDHQPIDAPRTRQRAGEPGELDRVRDASARQHEHFGHVETQRRLDQKSGIAHALIVVQGPARPQRTVTDRGVEHLQEEDAVTTVVRGVPVAGRGQRRQRRQHQHQQHDQIGIKTHTSHTRHFHPAAHLFLANRAHRPAIFKHVLHTALRHHTRHAPESKKPCAA
jgi:hypothetical protein